MVFVDITVKLVGSALNLYIHRGAACQSLLGIEIAGYGVYHLDGIRRRDIGGVFGNPDIELADTIDPDIISVFARSIDVELRAPEKDWWGSSGQWWVD